MLLEAKSLTLKMSENISYDTVTEAVNGLKARGFKVDFNLRENCIICDDQRFDPREFEIREVYRFEGITDPADQAIVYGIESQSGLKGVLVNGYGIYSEPLSDELAKKLAYHPN